MARRGFNKEDGATFGSERAAARSRTLPGGFGTKTLPREFDSRTLPRESSSSNKADILLFQQN